MPVEQIDVNSSGEDASEEHALSKNHIENIAPIIF